MINYKYVWGLIKDAWRTDNYIDKIKIWFMPTGWRPEDVKITYPSLKIKDPSQQEKYETKNSLSLIVYCWIQLLVALVFMFHLFTVLHYTDPVFNYLYAVFIFLSIFSYTSLLDQSRLTLVAETLKFFLGISIIYFQGYSWYNVDIIYTYLVGVIIIASFFSTIYFQVNNNQEVADLSIS
jgi:hypothetical protein